MEDIAHDASGPASPTPSDIALQQASRPDSPDKGKLRVFISYSREDLHFADQLDAALNAYGFECVIDRQGISGGEDWKRRLGNLPVHCRSLQGDSRNTTRTPRGQCGKMPAPQLV